MKSKKLLAISLAAFISVGVTACGEGEAPAAPDYSGAEYQSLHYDFYAYSGPNDGTYKIDGTGYTTGQDFRTVERFKEYKAAGMTIWLPQSSARMGVSINHGEKPLDEWEEETWTLRENEWANTKVFWDRAYEAGLDKIIMTDVQIQQWSSVKYGKLIGEGEEYIFASEAELDEYVEKHIALYADHPGFYGVMLADEPSYASVVSYGQVYKSVKRVGEKLLNRDIFVQTNLLPMREYGAGAYNLMPLLEWGDDEADAVTQEVYYDLVGGVHADDTVAANEELEKIQLAEIEANGGKEKTTLAKYRMYLSDFADSMESDYLQFDDYPLRDGSVLRVYFPEMQIAAEVAKERDIEYYMVTQSFATTNNGSVLHRQVSEKGAEWLNNTLLAFGVSQISYYTYWAKQDNATSHFNEANGAFISRTGEKTDLYYTYQKLMGQNQSFAPIKLNFRYQGSKVFTQKPTNFRTDGYTAWMSETDTFACVESVAVNKECVLVTESYDKANARYMYCVMNVVDTINKGSKAYQTAVVTFTGGYTHAAVYRNGALVGVEKLSGGALTVKNAPGEAAYIIPLR